MTDDTGTEPAPDPHEALEELPRDECLRLLAPLAIGRFAVTTPDGSPLVVPVNYVLDGEIVVFRSDPGLRGDAAGDRAPHGGAVAGRRQAPLDSRDPTHEPPLRSPGGDLLGRPIRHPVGSLVMRRPETSSVEMAMTASSPFGAQRATGLRRARSSSSGSLTSVATPVTTTLQPEL